MTSVSGGAAKAAPSGNNRLIAPVRRTFIGIYTIMKTGQTGWPGGELLTRCAKSDVFAGVGEAGKTAQLLRGRAVEVAGEGTVLTA